MRAAPHLILLGESKSLADPQEALGVGNSILCGVLDGAGRPLAYVLLVFKTPSGRSVYHSISEEDTAQQGSCTIPRFCETRVLFENRLGDAALAMHKIGTAVAMHNVDTAKHRYCTCYSITVLRIPDSKHGPVAATVMLPTVNSVCHETVVTPECS